VAGVALIAGAEPLVALRLGASMTALQVAIGALNDIVDASADAGRKPGKPIPAGLVSVGQGRAMAIGGAALGLALAAPSGVALVALAVVVLGIGAAYDLRAKGTPWSWLPFAVGIPLLPLYGWLGATGALPSWTGPFLPMAVLAGAALAVANGRADIARDEAAGRSSIAAALGPGRSWWVATGLLTVALAIALVSLAVRVGEAPLVAATAVVALVMLGIGLVGAGVVLGRSRSAARLERAWELQAVGVAAVGLGWVLAVGT
jgi:4-hydroxybenzoate polyprenyltransferase